MADIAQMTAWRDALLRARYAGIRTVEYDGKRITYGSDAEMANALSDLERRITSTSAQPITQVRITSSKGV